MLPLRGRPPGELFLGDASGPEARPLCSAAFRRAARSSAKGLSTPDTAMSSAVLPRLGSGGDAEARAEMDSDAGFGGDSAGRDLLAPLWLGLLGVEVAVEAGGEPPPSGCTGCVEVEEPGLLGAAAADADISAGVGDVGAAP